MAVGWIWILLVLLIAVAAVLVVALLVGRRQEPGSRQEPGGRRSTAREILDERYARGEIDTTEYHERLRELGGG
jgi:putative membrane protein